MMAVAWTPGGYDFALAMVAIGLALLALREWLFRGNNVRKRQFWIICARGVGCTAAEFAKYNP